VLRTGDLPGELTGETKQLEQNALRAFLIANHMAPLHPPKGAAVRQFSALGEALSNSIEEK
jgi:hypothetical protein